MQNKIYGETVVKDLKVIFSSDVDAKGEFLNYDGNQVVDWMAENNLYSEDGECSTYINKKDKYQPKEFQEIIDAILDESKTDKVLLVFQN